jgi:membrane protein DedA with SNARE-associated domain
MFLIISGVLGGRLIGSVGLAGIASALHSTGPRDDIGTAVFLLLMGLTLGALAGGILGRTLQKKFADNPDKLTLVTGVPWIAGTILVMGIGIFG